MCSEKLGPCDGPPSLLSVGPSSAAQFPEPQYPSFRTGLWNNFRELEAYLAGLVGGAPYSPCPAPSEPVPVHRRTQYTQRKFQKSRHPRPSSQYNQRLFGGDMEKFIQVLALPHMPAHLYMLVFLQPWVTSVTRASA